MGIQRGNGEKLGDFNGGRIFKGTGQLISITRTDGFKGKEYKAKTEG